MAVGFLRPEEAVDGGGAWQHAGLVQNSKKQKDEINQTEMENEFVSLMRDEDDAYTNKMELQAGLEIRMTSTSLGADP